MKIKQGLEEKYEEYKKINSEDDYSKCIIDCTEIMGNLIDEGKTFEEAEEEMLKTPDGDGLTGFMMGALISGLVGYHEKGDEIKIWWNKKSYGEPDDNGVKNPAIITI